MGTSGAEIGAAFGGNKVRSLHLHIHSIVEEWHNAVLTASDSHNRVLAGELSVRQRDSY